MAACTWSYADYTPYEVLGLPSNASVSEVRSAFKAMALRTHPDKQHPATSTPSLALQASSCLSSSCSGGGGAAPSSAGRPPLPVTFHAVKEASELLLDPFLRAAYDAARSHALVREVGAISDTFSLAEDFERVPVAAGEEGLAAEVEVYQCECRCGGVYEVALFADSTAPASRGRRTLRSECDSCSLVVEVIVE